LILAGLCLFVNKETSQTKAVSQINFINTESSLQEPITSIMTGENKVLTAVSSPLFISSQSMGSIFEEEEDNSIIKYTVKKGETINQIADKFNISTETILLVNELSSSSIKEGDELMILPVDGLLHMVESGETVEKIAKSIALIQRK